MELHKSDYWELVLAYLNGSISGQERTKLFQWLDEHPDRRRELNELEKLWNNTVDSDLPIFDTRQAWEKLQPRLRKHGTPVFRSLRRWPMRYAAAAAFLILTSMLLYFFLNPGYTEILVQTQPGETKQIVLPDGSLVFLNERSSLSYDARLGQNRERRVSLTGEAFFEVARDTQKQFIVRAGSTETRVLGTSFNIVSPDTAQQVKVSLFSGKVRFDPGRLDPKHLEPGRIDPGRSDPGGKSSLTLAPGEEILYNKLNNTLIKRQIENINFLFWKNKKLEFNNLRLEDVLALIGKNYDVTFRINDPKLRGLRVTSTFDHSSLGDIFNALETLLNIRIEGTDTVYIITTN